MLGMRDLRIPGTHSPASPDLLARLVSQGEALDKNKVDGCRGSMPDVHFWPPHRHTCTNMHLHSHVYTSACTHTHTKKVSKRLERWLRS